MYTWEGSSDDKNKVNRSQQTHRDGQNRNRSKVQTAKSQEIGDLILQKQNQKMSRSAIKRNLLYMSDNDLAFEDESKIKSVPKNEKNHSFEKRKIFPRPKFTDLPVPNHFVRDTSQTFVDHKFLQNFLNIHNLSREKALSNPELYKIHEKRVSEYIYPREVPKSQKTEKNLNRLMSETKLAKHQEHEQEREVEVFEVIPDHLILTKRWQKKI